jgi:hypothetical protein
MDLINIAGTLSDEDLSLKRVPVAGKHGLRFGIFFYRFDQLERDRRKILDDQVRAGLQHPAFNNAGDLDLLLRLGDLGGNKNGSA